MITDLEPNFFTDRPSRGGSATLPDFVGHGRAAHGRNAISTYDQLLSGSAAFPAYVLRRAGLLDPLSESLTHYRE